jgi:long-chain acyl-CoA synthetase
VTADSLRDRLRAVVALEPTADAIEFDELWHTWGELGSAIDGLDRMLDECGARAGDAVGLLARTTPGPVAALLTLIITGRRAVFLSPMQSDRQLVEELARLRCRAVVATSSDWDREGLAAATVTMGGSVIETGPNLSELIVRHRSDPAMTATSPNRPDVAVEMLTSGTTGPPKRIDLTFASIEAGLVSAEVYEGRSEPGPPHLRSGVVVTWNPLVHSSGLFDVLAAVYEGRRLSLLERFDVDRWTAAIRRHQAKVAGMTPTALRMVLDAGVDRDRLQSLKVVISGSAPLPVALSEEFEETFGIPVLEVYGATEFAGSVAGWTLADHRAFMPTKRGSQGRAQPGVELRVVDDGSGAEMPVDDVGVLQVRSAQTGGSWRQTTDRARIDGDGFLWISGRTDDVIIRGGFKVMPAKVAAVLESHAKVRSAAVVGIPDDRLGEVPVAAIEIEPGSDPPSTPELLDLARSQLAGYEVPTQIVVVRELPRTPSTKVSRPAVRQLFA